MIIDWNQQNSKAESPIVFNEAPKVTDSKFSQTSKAWDPITSTESGIITDFKFRQCLEEFNPKVYRK